MENRPSAKRSGLAAVAAVAAWAVLWCGDGLAFTKCEIDGKVVYQEAPCAQETVEQGLQRKELYATLHRRLDLLQVQGAGKVRRPTSRPEASAGEGSASEREERFDPMSGGAFRAAQRSQFAEYEEKTKQKNRESAGRLTAFLDEAKQACGGKLYDYPEIGMSDVTFRNCTIHARTGGVSQIVVDTYDSMPLRLYVFGTSRAQRVYSIDGVITAVRP